MSVVQACNLASAMPNSSTLAAKLDADSLVHPPALTRMHMNFKNLRSTGVPLRYAVTRARGEGGRHAQEAAATHVYLARRTP